MTHIFKRLSRCALIMGLTALALYINVACLIFAHHHFFFRHGYFGARGIRNYTCGSFRGGRMRSVTD